MQIYPPEWKEWVLDFWTGLREFWRGWQVIRQERHNKMRGGVGKLPTRSTSARRAILICYALAIAAACLWVPWQVRVSDEEIAWEIGLARGGHFVGYDFLWSPPQKQARLLDRMVRLPVIVDYGRIALELLALTAVCGIASLLAPRIGEPEKAKPRPDQGL